MSRYEKYQEYVHQPVCEAGLRRGHLLRGELGECFPRLLLCSLALTPLGGRPRRTAPCPGRRAMSGARCLRGGDAFPRVEDEHLLEQVDRLL